MHKNMQKLYESIGSYFSFDPQVVSVEDFFGELANFRILFMVSIEFMPLCACTWRVSSLLFLQSRHIYTHTHKHARTGTDRSHHPHMHTHCTHFRSLTHIGCSKTPNVLRNKNRSYVLITRAFSSNFQCVLLGGESERKHYSVIITGFN